MKSKMEQTELPLGSQMEDSAGAERKPGKCKSVRLMPVAIAVILIVISSTAIINGISIYVRGIQSLGYKMTDAKVVRIVEHFDAFAIRKEALMSYKASGKEREGSAPVPSGRVMKRGEETVVFLDPANPNNIVLNQEVDYDWVIVLCGYGLFVFCFGAFILFRSLRA